MNLNLKKMKIQQYKYEKTVTSSKDWEVPTEAQYFFETGIRRAIAVIPVYTSWNMENFQKPEEIYELSFVCVYQSFEAMIQKFDVSLSSLEDKYVEKGEVGDIVRFLIDHSEGCERSPERFKGDFDNCLNKIKEHLSIKLFG